MPIEFRNKKTQEHKIELIRIKEEEGNAKKTAERLGLPYVDLTFKPIQRQALSIIPEHAAKKANLAVILKRGDSISVAVRDSEDSQAKEIVENLRKRFKNVSIFIASRHGLEKAWANYPKSIGKEKISGQVAVSAQTLQQFQEKITSIEEFKKTAEELSSQKNVSIIVELLLASALSLKASDIHVEPGEETIRLRLRIDGLMRDAAEFDAHVYKLLLSRIKLLSSMKLNVHSAAQDGRFAVTLGDFEIQVRTSVLPGEYGENIVMRILNPESLLSIEELGIREDLFRIIQEQITKPYGMILTTGPTGSGKTTTLYAFLKKLKTPEVKIITVEDPIEYHIEGISQTQVAPEKGYTFASGLRAILRQDPDVILIGEIRDLETADTALQAALTGHLLLSTLHTNDAAGVVPRMVDIGASPATIGPALNMAIAQRLIRRVCDKCKTMRKANSEEITLLEHVLSKLPTSVKLPKEINQSLEIPESKGCDKCSGTGYKGRIGIYEILVSTPEFEKFILNTPSITEIRGFAMEKGMTTLKQDGFLKVLEGLTTIAEVERVAGE